MVKYIPGILFFLSGLLQAQIPQMQSTAHSPVFFDSDTSRINTLIELANECRFYYPDDLMRYNKEALDLSQKTEYQYGEALALKGIADYYYHNSRYDSAMIYLEKAELIFKKLEKTEELMDIIGMYCYMCVAQGEYNKALESGLRALRSADDLGGHHELLDANSFLGYVYCSIGDYEKSLEHYFAALAMAIEEKDNNAQIASLKSELARVYEKMEKRSLAIEYYNDAARLLKNEPDAYLQGIARLNQAESLYCQGFYGSALETFFASYSAIRGLNDHRTSTRILSRIGTVYPQFAKNDGDLRPVDALIRNAGFDDIEDLMKQTITKFELSKSRDDLVVSLESLAEYYRLQNRYRDVFLTNERLISLKDTVAIANQANTLSQMLVAYDMEQRKKSLDLLEAKTLANEEKIKIQQQQQIIVIIITIILLLAGFGLYHRIRTIRRIKNQIQESNELLKAEKLRAEKSEKFKERFLTNVSHEIRTPMNAIMGISNLLIKNEHFSEQEKYLEAMNISARHLLVLINDILDLSKLESGKFVTEKNPFVLGNVLSKIEEELKPVAESRKLGLYFNVDDKIPEIILGDSKVLHQILLSLLRNGVEFTSKGRVDLVCRLTGTAHNVVLLGFTVQDTGKGMNKKLLESLFSKFVGEVSFDRKLFDKSGLELLINKQLIEILGGTITVDSLPGKGTTFYFELPYELPEESAEPLSKTIEEPSMRSVDGISVLLVEDNAFNVMVARDELEAAIKGIRVDIAGDGQVAVEKVASRHYDVILMDIQMPVMNGYDATRAIRRMNGEKAKIPIIAMTANIMKSEVEKCFEAGMNDFISKPFDSEDLVERIRKLRVLNTTA
jgi:signal transduction histidine kinase/ActR/RegA family two-component response regulator